MSASSALKMNERVSRWLENDCPQELVATVLAFAGPREVSALSEVTTGAWFDLMRSEALWRVLCLELHKYKSCEPEPKSWRQYYRRNLLVPLEVQSIQAALESTQGRHNDGAESSLNNIRILLLPGRYQVEDTIVVNILGRLTIETVEVAARVGAEIETDRIPTKRAAKILGNANTTNNNAQHASIVMQTTKRNQPTFHVLQGNLSLKNVKLEHSCYGRDILRGNAAIHLQPTPLPNSSPSHHMPVVGVLPSVSLESVEVTSFSGQGIMNYCGGDVLVKNCYIHDCAATGLYADSPQCEVRVQQSDIMANGHAGLHFEFGTGATVVDCGIVGNSSIGVSVHDTVLSLELSDVVANGYQLETERTPIRLRKNNIHAVWNRDENDGKRQLESRPHRWLTRTPMAQRNFDHHLSKLTLLMDNYRRVTRQANIEARDEEEASYFYLR